MPTNSKKEQNGAITLKEAANNLDISESTIKKYMKDFELESDKGPTGKLMISQELFQMLTEIIKLRANGLSIQEIKELRSQEPPPSKTISLYPDEEKVEQETKVDTETVFEISKTETNKSTFADELLKEEESDKTETEETDEEKKEDVERELLELKEDEETEQAPRKKGFNYRYVERQISNDSKRVNSLRHRLKNVNISVQERLFIEESLERRILFLDGWKHLLKWVSTK